MTVYYITILPSAGIDARRIWKTSIPKWPFLVPRLGSSVCWNGGCGMDVTKNGIRCRYWWVSFRGSWNNTKQNYYYYQQKEIDFAIYIVFFCVSVGCWYSSLQNCEGDHSVILQRVLACSSAVVCHWNRLLIRLRCRFMMSCIRSIDVWFYLFQRTWLFMNVWMYDSYDVLVFYSSISISQWVSSRTRKWNTSTKRRN